MKQIPWDDQARELMQPSADASPWAMVEGFENAMHGAHLWQIDQGGACVLLALRGVQLAHGRLLDVVGMRSVGDRFQAAQLGPVVEGIARTFYEGVDLLSMCTRHAHLVRACERQGWAAVAQIVNKPLRLAT
ncbi:MAG TPA: hypothetical protein VF442_10545 [Sphingobium sp.]